MDWRRTLASKLKPPVLNPPAFRMRLVLAATTSSLYGIYSGFELCENRARPDSEVYLDSEMYQHKVWDWDRPDNIVDLVVQVNRIRQENPALQIYDNLRFYPSDHEQLLCYGKSSADGSNIIVVVLNLDPFAPHEGLDLLGCERHASRRARARLTRGRGAPARARHRV